MTAPPQPLRVAVVGASHWHLYLYLPTLLELPDVALAGVSDRDERAAQALGERLGCPWSVSDEQLHDDVRPDFV
ncbi:MAG TPA: hypothetical protein VGN22_21755, partial [Pseudonocardia sp.]